MDWDWFDGEFTNEDESGDVDLAQLFIWSGLWPDSSSEFRLHLDLTFSGLRLSDPSFSKLADFEPTLMERFELTLDESMRDEGGKGWAKHSASLLDEIVLTLKSLDEDIFAILMWVKSKDSKTKIFFCFTKRESQTATSQLPSLPLVYRAFFKSDPSGFGFQN